MMLGSTNESVSGPGQADKNLKQPLLVELHFYKGNRKQKLTLVMKGVHAKNPTPTQGDVFHANNLTPNPGQVVHANNLTSTQGNFVLANNLTQTKRNVVLAYNLTPTQENVFHLKPNTNLRE